MIGLLAGGVVAIAAVAVGVWLVGKDDGPAYSLPVAATNATEITSISYEMEMIMGAAGQAQAVADYDIAERVMSTEIEMPGVDEPVTTLYDFDENSMYMESAPFAGLGLTVDAPWLAVDLQSMTGMDMGAAAAANDQNPLSIAPLLASSTAVEDLGRVEIDGVDVAHYVVTVDQEAAIEAQPQVFGGVDPAALESLPDTVDYEVWVTQDNQLRRMAFEFEMAGEVVSMTLDVVSLNEPLDIEMPADGDTVDFADIMAGQTSG